MPTTPSEAALTTQAARIALADRTARDAARVWRNADPAYLDISWNVIAPALVGLVGDSQVEAATSARSLADVTAVAYQSAGLNIEPAAFAGVDITGREIGPGMFGAVTVTKSLIGSGAASDYAMQVGMSYLVAKTKTAVQDAGRQADIAAAAGKGWTHYVRVVSPGACSRCAVLAGKSAYKTTFPRHPACKCSSCPLEGDGSGPVPAGLHAAPNDYFDSLTPAEQDRIFTADGAKAIRDGADLGRVVNARRGMYQAGRVQATKEGTTFRSPWARDRKNGYTIGAGDRYRKTTRVRLMPESIYQLAGDDTALARRMLFDNGYFAYSGLSRAELIASAGRDAQLAERLLSAAGYR